MLFFIVTRSSCMNKVSLAGNGNLPLANGIKHLYGNLYLVPFKSIQIAIEAADPKASKYSFTNPRLLTEKGQKSLTNKESSARLRNDIKNHGLMHPFVCIWLEKDGEMMPQLIGGHNRANALSKLMADKEKVKDISKDQPTMMTLNSNKEIVFLDEFSSASKVYENVLCVIYAVDEELDSLEISYSENSCRENLTVGHDIAILRELIKIKTTDEKIIKILQKDEKWLKSVRLLLDKIDSSTLEDLIEDRITLESAFELSKIADLEVRHIVRDTAIQESMEDHGKKLNRIKKQIAESIIQKDIAEGSLVEAEFNNDESKAKKVEDAINEIEQKSQRLIAKAQILQPKATVKNIKSSKTSHQCSDTQKRGLKGKSIQIIFEYIDGLLQVAEAKNADSNTIDKLMMCRKLTKAILEGSQNWKELFVEFDSGLSSEMPELDDELNS